MEQAPLTKAKANSVLAICNKWFSDIFFIIQTNWHLSLDCELIFAPSIPVAMVMDCVIFYASLTVKRNYLGISNICFANKIASCKFNGGNVANVSSGDTALKHDIKQEAQVECIFNVSAEQDNFGQTKYSRVQTP